MTYPPVWAGDQENSSRYRVFETTEERSQLVNRAAVCGEGRLKGQAEAAHRTIMGGS